MKKAIKILLITDHHTPHGGGAERYFFTLKDHLQNAGHSVFSMGFGDHSTQGTDFAVIKGTRSHLTRLTWNILFHPFKYRALRKHITAFKPDIIHLHNIRNYTISLLHAVKGYPVVQTVHDFYPVCPSMTNIHLDQQPCPTGLRLNCLFQHKGRYPFLGYLGVLIAFSRMRKLLKQTVQHFLTPSPFLASYLEKNDFVPTTVILPFIEQPDSLPNTTPNTHQFLYIGRIEKNKGVDILINEFAEACKKNSFLILKLAGEGNLKTRLTQKIKLLKLENNIYFLGKINEPELLQKQVDESTALIFPSIGMESFGLVITEAMSRARAVIGSNRGTTAWLIDHQKTGLLFDPLQKGNLAESILTLANHSTLSAQYGKNGFEKLTSFPDKKTLVEKITQIYKETLLTRLPGCSERY